jgi:hypothetical protein
VGGSRGSRQERAEGRARGARHPSPRLDRVDRCPCTSFLLLLTLTGGPHAHSHSIILRHRATRSPVSRDRRVSSRSSRSCWQECSEGEPFSSRTLSQGAQLTQTSLSILRRTYDQREQAAGGIGDLVLRTSEAGIKPYIVQLTGPLIRVISSQTFPPAVKNAMYVFDSSSPCPSSYSRLC